MIKQWKALGLAAVAVAVAATMVFSSVALAQGNGPANQAATGNAQAQRQGNGSGGSGAGYGLAVRGAWGGADASLVAVAAEVLGMEQADLVAELQSGKTIAQVATENGVDAQELVTAYLAPRADFLAQAVADGRITQEQADAMLARMSAMVTSKLNQAWQPQGNGNCTGTCGGGGQGMGAGWVDSNGDGVCDNAAGAGGSHHGGRGQAGGMGRHSGRMQP